MSDNPLLQAWATPFGAPPFDRIRAHHFPPAFAAAMAEHLAEIEAIAANPAPPGFANTIEAMERAGRALGRVGATFSNLAASHGTPELQAVEREMAPKLAAHHSAVALNPRLFARVAALHEQRDSLGLAPDQLRLLERAHLGFVRAGAALSEPGRARMAEINTRLATLHTTFGQNVLHDEKDWTLPLDEAGLAGLPGFVVEGARQAAAERGMDGHVVTLSRSLIEPFLTFSPRRDLRQAAWQAWVSRGMHPGAHDNRPLIPEILALRAERARLLGFAHFADFRLADSMAGTPDAVRRLTGEVWTAGRRRAGEEAARLLAEAAQDGINHALEPWDWRHYAERVRQAEYDLDETRLKPYFELERIQQAAFETANRLFGLTFHPRTDIPLYHPDVRAYEVRDADGHVGLFLADHFARPDKRSGAWMSSYRDQENLSHLGDAPIAPIIVNNNNFARGTPTLLSFDDATTLFHEFGHALHGLLSQVRYPSQSGTSVRRDFVEFPSQIYEHWLEDEGALRRHARHHETGEPLPDDIIARLLAARTFNQGFATVEFLASAILDMELHTHPTPHSLDIETFEAETLAQLGMPREIGARHRPAHFQHLFSGGGYAAGYYSYLWAEVLDADGFDAFTETGNPFHPETAARLKRVLQSGDTRDPMDLYIEFRGRPPETTALLRMRGLA
jgi:peptidyl-dipeptidase Dcp